jgi:hypothetical protein
MIRTCIRVGLVFLATAAFASQTPAKYDRATEKTISGTIKAVASYPGPDGSVGVHLDLKTADGTMVSVHVGPALYVGQQNFWFFADDQIEVIGSKVTQEWNTPIWAKAILKGSSGLILRNDDGTPKWTPAGEGTDGCGVTHPPLARATEY